MLWPRSTRSRAEAYGLMVVQAIARGPLCKRSGRPSWDQRMRSEHLWLVSVVLALETTCPWARIIKGAKKAQAPGRAALRAAGRNAVRQYNLSERPSPFPGKAG